jgi:hypothetical protein
MFKRKFRIVSDRYAGFEVQSWIWYFPFWIEAGGVNTFETVEQAELYAKKRMRVSKVIKYL